MNSNVMPSLILIATVLGTPWLSRPEASVVSQESPPSVSTSPPNVSAIGESDSDDLAAYRVLQTRCLECHGPSQQESGLRLDQRDAILAGGDSLEDVVVASAPAESLLIRLVRGEDAFRQMPPDGPRLSDAEIASLEQWIADGSQMPEGGLKLDLSLGDHWAFQPMRRPAIPSLDQSQLENPIDCFIGSRLRQAGLDFSPEADRVMLARRLYLVLLGIPPTPEQVAVFENDLRPDAYERLVDRVLASPRFGERWATHWLDIARFGETDGFETNRERPAAFYYRDYVIDAFNHDLPYDQFVRDQIAGDVLGARVGTGFLVAGPNDIVKSPDIQLTLTQRQDELADIVNTTGTAFLGLTIGCARCHNHKFDPISQQDYYALQAVFAGVQHGTSRLPVSPEAKQRQQRIELEIRQLQAALAGYLEGFVDRPLSIDDRPTTHPWHRGLVELSPSRGAASHRSGVERGEASDAGDSDRSSNFSQRYYWWDNQPDQPIAFYRLHARGNLRLWISWGCGWPTHSPNATYWLDHDGQLSTSDDQTLIATVDQRYFADGEPIESLDGSRWSGLYNAGIYQLTGTEILVLRGGSDGTVVSADNILLQPMDEASIREADHHSITDQPPRLAAPLQAIQNEERFTERSIRFLRFEILATGSGAAPCIDELEVWSGEENVALASDSVTLTASGTIAGYERIHQLRFINDGKYGNSFSWISERPGGGWVELEFAQPVTVDRIRWGRDRTGQFADRLASEYEIRVASEPGDWEVIASHLDHVMLDTDANLLPRYDFASVSPLDAMPLQAMRDELTRLSNEWETTNNAPTAYVGQFMQPGETHLLYRGDPLTPRERVDPDTLNSFGRLNLDADADESRRRAAIAQWIAHRENPLTARVMANRIWQHLFGQGIVTTPSDFGINGIPPVHPQLLDWLACEFAAIESSTDVEHGSAVRFETESTTESEPPIWSTKLLIRQIVTSRTFRQSSHPNENGLRVDAAAQLLWRYPTRRLEAEVIRDSMLATCGTLRTTMRGPGFSAFEVALENVRHYFPKRSFGPSDWRRMVYMTKVRQEKDAVFGAFDCPDASQVQPNRSRSTTPTQALNLFNSAFTLQQAEYLAERLVHEAESNRASASNGSRDPIARLFAIAYGRAPANEEWRAATQFAEQHGLVQLCRVILNSNEFLFIP